MSNTSEAHEGAPITRPWTGKPNVEETPTHITVDITGGYGDAENDVIASLETKPENAPPDKVTLRKKLYGGDILAQDQASGDGSNAVVAFMVCHVAGLSLSHFKRMNYTDAGTLVEVMSHIMLGKV